MPTGVCPSGDTVAPPRLMAMWDSPLMAYADRTRLVSVDYRSVVTRTNGDVLPTLLVDGYVTGVWRSTDGGIQAHAFKRLSKGVWNGLAEEANELAKLLSDRDLKALRRYDHWWAKLPEGDERLIGI